VRFAVSREVSTPFAWGIWKPVVVLPAEAEQWSEEQARSVLLHELAHIARWDYPLHLLVEIVSAFYWPNPLVRLAARRRAMERERACDDCALRQGVPSRVYASHLLHIARLQVRQGALAGATTMAGEHGLFERIKSVTDEKVKHAALHGDTLTAALIIVLLLVFPFGTLDLLGKSREIPSTDPLVQALESNADPLVRQRAAWWLGEHEARGAVMPIVSALGDESHHVRLTAAWALGEIKDRKTITPLIKALEDPHPLVREMAVLALGEIEHPSAVPVLSKTFDRDTELRGAVIWALGEIRGEEAKKARAGAFKIWGRAPWENDQVWAGELIRGPLVKREGGRYKAEEESMDYTEDLPTLLARLRDGSDDTRRKAAFNCGVLGIRDRYESMEDVETVVDALLKALCDPVPEVRAMAIWSLDEINPSRSRRLK
jgi:HEAT repeat protein